MESKENLTKKALKAGSFYIVVQFIVRGLSFLVTPIYTRLLTTEQYGIVKIFESWLLIMVPIVTLGLFRSVEVAKYDYRERFNEYVSSIVKLGLILCIGFSVICLVAKDFVCKILDFTPWMLYIMLVYIFAEFAIMAFQRREKQMMRYKNTVIFTSVFVPISIFVSVALLIYGNKNGATDEMLFYRIGGYYIPYVLAGIFIAIVVMLQGKSNTLVEDWKYGLKFSIPLIAELVSIQIMNQIDKIMIQKMVGDSQAGIYSLATTISYIIWIIEDSVWGAWQPWLYEKLDRNEESDINKPWNMMMHLFGIISIGLVAIAPEIILILGGTNYKAAVYLIAPLVVSTLFRFYSYSFSAVQNYQKKTKFVAIATVIVMMFNVVANYVGIKIWGYVAAAYATTFSYFVLIIVLAIFEKKVTRKIIMPFQKTILIALAYFGVCELFILTYNLHFTIRYVLIIIVLLAFFFINRKSLFALLKMLKKKEKNSRVEDV